MFVLLREQGSHSEFQQLRLKSAHFFDLNYPTNCDDRARTARDAKLIFNDVHKRIQKLISKKVRLTEEQKMDEFLTIVFEYYSAMPYFRGSSSIGDVAFSGLYTYVFGRTIARLEDGTDMIAMVNETPQEFIKRYRGELQ